MHQGQSPASQQAQPQGCGPPPQNLQGLKARHWVARYNGLVSTHPVAFCTTAAGTTGTKRVSNGEPLFKANFLIEASDVALARKCQGRTADRLAVLVLIVGLLSIWSLAVAAWAYCLPETFNETPSLWRNAWAALSYLAILSLPAAVNALAMVRIHRQTRKLASDWLADSRAHADCPYQFHEAGIMQRRPGFEWFAPWDVFGAMKEENGIFLMPVKSSGNPAILTTRGLTEEQAGILRDLLADHAGKKSLAASPQPQAIGSVFFECDFTPSPVEMRLGRRLASRKRRQEEGVHHAWIVFWAFALAFILMMPKSAFAQRASPGLIGLAIRWMIFVQIVLVLAWYWMWSQFYRRLISPRAIVESRPHTRASIGECGIIVWFGDDWTHLAWNRVRDMTGNDQMICLMWGAENDVSIPRREITLERWRALDEFIRSRVPHKSEGFEVVQRP